MMSDILDPDWLKKASPEELITYGVEKMKLDYEEEISKQVEEIERLKRKLADALVWKIRLDEAAGVVEKQEQEIERLKRLVPLPPTGKENDENLRNTQRKKA